ncbi:MAG: hypothetical protein ACFFAU_01470 [Candidatus Hodarchaeota archaeon]
MKKDIIKISLIMTIIAIMMFPEMIVKAKTIGMKKSDRLEYLLENKYYKDASELMSQEIIKQLKEKKSITIEDYLIKKYFERMMGE